ncbi:hypothetical protein BU15DRAFT_81290 [Melanogaster broomeanus]|nr:hypothetical protein BU15DRAFT_81290 [Melanogaster broomeanus]
MFPGDTKSSANDIPDMSDKVIPVISGTAGLGKRLQGYYSRRAPKIGSQQPVTSPKARVPFGELKSVNGKDAYLLFMDPANLKSIKAAAEEFVRCAFSFHSIRDPGEAGV